MEDVLSLIRSLAEQLQDPPEIPYEGEVRDQERVEQDAHTRFTSEQFVADADPTKEPAKPYLPPDANTRQPQGQPDTEVAKEPVKPYAPTDAAVRSPQLSLTPEAVFREVLPTPAPEPNLPQAIPPVLPDVIRGERYDIAPAEITRPTPEAPQGLQIYEPIQVAAAMATAQLSSPEVPKQVEVVENTRMVSQQVTANTRVTHVIPDGFPVDVGHAFAAVDRDVTLPEVEVEPTKIGPFRPAAVPPSTEKMVFEGFTMNSSEQDRHARLVF